MTKQIFLVVALLISPFVGAQDQALSPQKQLFIQQAQLWVAEQEQVTQQQVAIAAMDRRLKIPDCANSFSFSFPYASSTGTLRAQCLPGKWQAFVGVTIYRQVKGFAFVRDMNAGDSPIEADLQPTVVARPVKDLIDDLQALQNHSLTSAVTVGEILNRRHLVKNATVFQLRRDILAEEVIQPADIIRLTRGLPMTSSSQRFPARLLDQAIAARDLQGGQLLSRSDLRIKHRVVTSTAALSHGQKLSAENTEIRDYYGKLPKDALLSMADISQMEAIRTIRVGQLLRASDLKPATLIKKGDSVKLTVGGGLLKITVTMVALDNGKRDQQINLLNPESGEEVRAIVTGAGQARGL
ncbi:MAG: flagellar basal body P-ring formation chaperone FlgA [Porticoccaceae bacterium]|nr:flagellar basal body P-ring formation chaperone FlgA [Porticoccaceae bacterium]